MVKVVLDNAQSSGPRITITDGGVVVGRIFPNSAKCNWCFNERYDIEGVIDMPKRDGLILYSNEYYIKPKKLSEEVGIHD